MLEIKRFTAPWCSPCKVLGPILDELSTEHADVEFTKVDVDETPEVAGEFGVMGVPRVMFFKDGVKVEDFAGLKPKDAINELIQQHK